MDNILRYILESICENPSAVMIEKSEPSMSEVLFKVQVDEADKGRVIGKAGRTINSIRNIISIIGRREGKKVSIKVEDSADQMMPQE